MIFMALDWDLMGFTDMDQVQAMWNVTSSSQTPRLKLCTESLWEWLMDLSLAGDDIEMRIFQYQRISSRGSSVTWGTISGESMLCPIFQEIENWFTFVHNWSLDVENLQWPYWICCSSLTHILRGVSSLLFKADRPSIIGWTLHVNCDLFYGINSLFAVNLVTSGLKAETTSKASWPLQRISLMKMWSSSLDCIGRRRSVYPNFDWISQRFLDPCERSHSLFCSSHHRPFWSPSSRSIYIRLWSLWSLRHRILFSSVYSQTFYLKKKFSIHWSHSCDWSPTHWSRDLGVIFSLLLHFCLWLIFLRESSPLHFWITFHPVKEQYLQLKASE